MIPLQTLRDLIIDGKVFQVVVEVFTGAAPLPVVAALVFLPIGAAYYIVQQRIIIPVIMTILVGGVTVARAPASFSTAIVALITLALAGGVYVLIQRSSVTQ
jgi:hypothetical protein